MTRIPFWRASLAAEGAMVSLLKFSHLLNSTSSVTPLVRDGKEV